MNLNLKVEQKLLQARQIEEVQQIRELSKEDLKEISGGCGRMGGIAVAVALLA
jgi:bacteriocin-like protein